MPQTKGLTQFGFDSPKNVVRLTLPQSETRSSPSPHRDGSAPRLRRNSPVTTFSNTAPPKAKVKSKPIPCTCNSFASENVTTPTPVNVTVPVKETLTDVGLLVDSNLVFHLLRSFKPEFSWDECMFLFLSLDGLRRAIYLAPIFHWRYQRPLQALLAAMNARDRNYSARNAKRKPLSGSSVSSRKRSSGA